MLLILLVRTAIINLFQQKNNKILFSVFHHYDLSNIYSDLLKSVFFELISHCHSSLAGVAIVSQQMCLVLIHIWSILPKLKCNLIGPKTLQIVAKTLNSSQLQQKVCGYFYVNSVNNQSFSFSQIYPEFVMQ